MKSSKFIIGIVLLFFGLVAIYFTFFSSSKKNISSRNVNLKKSNANSLFAVATGKANPCLEEDGFTPKKGCRNHDVSLFDSEFMKPTGLNYEEDLAQNPDYVYPTNPQTGKPFDEEALAQFDELRKYFPNNDLIPKKLTKAENDQKAQKDNNLIKASNAVGSGKYTLDEANIHFDSQRKNANDRIQIIEYLIDQQKEDGEIDKDGQFQKILDAAKEQGNQIDKQKEEALSRLK
jgi:hypothetical protein